MLVVVAAASSALHAMIFDNRQSAFIAARRGEGDPLDSEIETIRQRLSAGSAPGTGRPGRAAELLSSFYLNYLLNQKRVVGFFRLRPFTIGDNDESVERTLIRLWSYLGPTTNRTVLIASALIGRLDLYLWFAAVIGNLWLWLMVFLERRAASISE